jgi:hypothetical protein
VISDKTKCRLSILQYGQFEWFPVLAQGPAQDFDVAIVVVNDNNLSWVFESM